MEYDKENIFAKILRGEIPCDKVYEDDWTLAFKDINPQAPTHILVIPKEGRSTLADCGEEDMEMLGRLQLAAIKAAKQEGLDSYRTVVNIGKSAGQEVFHLHIHVLGGRNFSWPPG